MSLWTSSDIDGPADTTVTGTITLARTITLTSGDTSTIKEYDQIGGTGIPVGIDEWDQTVVASVVNGTVFTINRDATNGTGISITVKHKNPNKPKYETVAAQLVTAGFDAAETAKTPVAHAGWVKVTTGSGGRSGRKQYETLVAMGSLTGAAADNTLAPEPTVTITLPSNLTGLGIAMPVSAAATVIGTGLTGKLRYQWQVSANGTTGWANVTGQINSTLATTANAGTPVQVDYYRLLVDIGGKIIGTSANFTATTAAALTTFSGLSNLTSQVASALFTLTATQVTVGATAAVRYQWAKSSTNTDANYVDLTGETALVLSSQHANATTLTADWYQLRAIMGVSTVIGTSSVSVTTA